jgi:hypothetical protein
MQGLGQREKKINVSQIELRVMYDERSNPEKVKSMLCHSNYPSMILFLVESWGNKMSYLFCFVFHSKDSDGEDDNSNNHNS